MLKKVWLVQTNGKPEIWTRQPTAIESLKRIRKAMDSGIPFLDVIFTWNAIGLDVFYPDGAPADEDSPTVQCDCGTEFQVEKHYLGQCPNCHNSYSTVGA